MAVALSTTGTAEGRSRAGERGLFAVALSMTEYAERPSYAGERGALAVALSTTGTAECPSRADEQGLFAVALTMTETGRSARSVRGARSMTEYAERPPHAEERQLTSCGPERMSG